MNSYHNFALKFVFRNKKADSYSLSAFLGKGKILHEITHFPSIEPVTHLLQFLLSKFSAQCCALIRRANLPRQLLAYL